MAAVSGLKRVPTSPPDLTIYLRRFDPDKIIQWAGIGDNDYQEWASVR